MELLELARKARVYDLGQPYFIGMPHFPTHPPFLYGLTKKHGEVMLEGGASSAADSLAMGGHTGTHIDALNHFSCNGVFFGGGRAEDAQGWTGIPGPDAAAIGPVVRRGVLLDVAGVDEVTPEALDAACAREGVAVQPGDVVLLRTGYGAYFEDVRRYFPGGKAPGPELPGALWLSARKVFAAGSDTLAFEKVPSTAMPVHVHLLVESGIHIIENLNLEELARDGVWTFLFVAAPLKIRGGTGGPLRPMALVGS